MNTKYFSISQQEKFSFVSNLCTMISAGIPILSSIDSLSEDTKGNIKKMLDSIRADILQGKQLHVAFAKFPRVFNKVSVNMVKASEEAGTLDGALRDLRDQIKKDIEFQGKIRSAMIYPFLVMGVFLAILLMILIVVIPKIATVFSQLKVDLPLPTRVLIFTSNLLIYQTWYVIGVLAFLIGGCMLLYRVKKEWFQEAFYNLPIISLLTTEIDIMRFSSSMHLLLRSGITITSALELSEDVVLKKNVSRAIAHAKESVYSGKTISSSLKQQKKIFPSIMIRLLEAGEKTGTLDNSLQDIAAYFDYKITDTLKTLTVALEPILLVVVGVVVGGMMLAIIAPIYNLIGQISPH